MDGDDIKWANTTMPEFPKGMPLGNESALLVGGE